MDSSLYKDETRAPGLLGTTILVSILAFVSLCLRWWLHRVSDLNYWWDDWLAFASSIPILGILVVIAIWVKDAGLGHHTAVLSSEQLAEGSKLQFTLFWFYNFGLTFPKISVLFFYARVFGRGRPRWFKVASFVAGFLVLARLIYGIISSLLQCRPIAKIFDATVPGTCLDSHKTNIASITMDAGPDIVILLIPMPLIWGIQAKLTKKISIVSVFALGYCVALISVAAAVHQAVRGGVILKDPTYNSVEALYFIPVEVDVSVVGICLPAILRLVIIGRNQGFKSILLAVKKEPGVSEIHQKLWTKTSARTLRRGSEATTAHSKPENQHAHGENTLLANETTV